MTKYIFRFNKADQFICIKVEQDGEPEVFRGEDAINLLKEKDRIKFKKAKIVNDRIVLETPNTKVVISDVEKFNDQGLYEYLRFSLEKINKAINKYNRNLDVKPGVKKGIATASVVVGLLLAATSGKAIADKISNAPDKHGPEIEQEYDGAGLEDIVKYANFEDDLSDIANVDADLVSSIDNYYSPIDDLPYDTISMLEELDSGTKINVSNISLSFDTEYDEVKYNHVVDNYDSMIQERATRWGVDPQLATCMISQESGGYETNLMQIQFDSWKDQPITVYNFEKNGYETIILTDNPENYKSRANTQIIGRENLKNPKTNISIGCILLQYSFKQMNNNLPAAIQCYNFGTGNMTKVLSAASREKGLSVDEILANTEDVSFLDYRSIVSVGDKEYLEHVVRYLQEPEDGIWIKVINEDGEVEPLTVAFTNENSLGR